MSTDDACCGSDTDVDEDYNRFAVLSIAIFLPMAVASVLAGFIALKQIRNTGQKGKPLALVGIALGLTVTSLKIVWGIHLFS